VLCSYNSLCGWGRVWRATDERRPEERDRKRRTCFWTGSFEPESLRARNEDWQYVGSSRPQNPGENLKKRKPIVQWQHQHEQNAAKQSNMKHTETKENRAKHTRRQVREQGRSLCLENKRFLGSRSLALKLLCSLPSFAPSQQADGQQALSGHPPIHRQPDWQADVVESNGLGQHFHQPLRAQIQLLLHGASRGRLSKTSSHGVQPLGDPR